MNIYIYIYIYICISICFEFQAYTIGIDVMLKQHTCVCNFDIFKDFITRSKAVQRHHTSIVMSPYSSNATLRQGIASGGKSAGNIH